MIIRNDNFEVLDSFRYLGNSIFQSGTPSTDRVRVARKNFNSLLPVLKNSGISLKFRRHAYNACIRSALNLKLKLD